MDEQVYKELYQIYCKALTKKSLDDVLEHFNKSGVKVKLVFHNAVDPLLVYTTIILRKGDTTLKIDSTDLNGIIKGVID